MSTATYATMDLLHRRSGTSSSSLIIRLSQWPQPKMVLPLLRLQFFFTRHIDTPLSTAFCARASSPSRSPRFSHWISAILPWSCLLLLLPYARLRAPGLGLPEIASAPLSLLFPRSPPPCVPGLFCASTDHHQLCTPQSIPAPPTDTQPQLRTLTVHPSRLQLTTKDFPRQFILDPLSALSGPQTEELVARFPHRSPEEIQSLLDEHEAEITLLERYVNEHGLEARAREVGRLVSMRIEEEERVRGGKGDSGDEGRGNGDDEMSGDGDDEMEM